MDHIIYLSIFSAPVNSYVQRLE